MDGPSRSAESGFSLVALIAAMTIMMIVMGAATPSWKYVMQDMREEELFFRGDQIAGAIERYQKKNGNTLPVSLEILVKGKYLRKAYAEPMTKHGKWRMIRPGEVAGVGMPPGFPGQLPGGPGQKPGQDPSPAPGKDWSKSASPPPTTIGPFVGVASWSKEKSFRLMNGRNSYDQWLFIAGQPRVIGKLEVLRPPMVPPGGAPGMPPPGRAPGMPPVPPNKR